MSAAAASTRIAPANRGKSCWLGTPEVYFRKTIDNSRLVKIEDPRRAREMKHFGIALCCLFALVMLYAFQHFRAIEYGYQIESMRTQRDGLVEMNRALRLEEASLRDPERIDVMARKLGLQSPQPGQVIHLDVSTDTGSPVMASVTPVSVVSAR
ncbi:MAG TPA: cell division protein FtsL [Terriglobales bacterium]|nr:cell division protein FtsL [Terriglobales bacterium]